MRIARYMYGAADLLGVWEFFGAWGVPVLAGVPHEEHGVVGKGGGAHGASRERAIRDQRAELFDDAVAGDLDGTVVAGTVA